MKQPPLFFLQPAYWRQSAGKKASVEECSKGTAPGEAAEVSAERKRVKTQQGGAPRRRSRTRQPEPACLPARDHRGDNSTACE